MLTNGALMGGNSKDADDRDDLGTEESPPEEDGEMIVDDDDDAEEKARYLRSKNTILRDVIRDGFWWPR